MHILLIHQFFLEDSEGGGTRWNDLSRIWVRHGHRVTVLAGSQHYMQSGGSEKKQRGTFISVNQYGVRVIRCSTGSYYNRSFSHRLFSFLRFGYQSLVDGQRYATDRYDLVICSSPPLFDGLSGYFLSRIKQIPLLFEVRDLWPESLVSTGMLRNKVLIQLLTRLERFLYRKSMLVNVLTPAFRDHLLLTGAVPDHKIICIPNGADFSITDRLLTETDRNLLRKELGFTNRFVLMYVGAHGYANDLAQLLDVAGRMLHTNLLLVLIGDGMQKPKLVTMAKQKHLHNVLFMDMQPKEQTLRYLVAANMGVSVLRKSTVFRTIYSNKTFDYLACKKPVLMLIDGLSRELIEHAGAGVYADPDSPEEIVQKIVSYQNAPEKVKEEGEKGYIFARKHFNKATLAMRYLQLIDKMLYPNS